MKKKKRGLTIFVYEKLASAFRNVKTSTNLEKKIDVAKMSLYANRSLKNQKKINYYTQFQKQVNDVRFSPFFILKVENSEKNKTFVSNLDVQ